MTQLLQTITTWASTSDSYGGNTFSAPIKVRGRWENKQELVRKQDGEEYVSKAVVYLSCAVNIGDYVALGDQTLYSSPLDVDGAHQVMMFNSSPAIAGSRAVRKAVL